MSRVRTPRRPAAPRSAEESLDTPPTDLTVFKAPPAPPDTELDQLLADPATPPAPEPLRFNVGTLRPVACPLYPGLVVWFRTNSFFNVSATVNDALTMAAREPQEFCRWISRIARRFDGWTFEDEDGTPFPP